MIIDSTFSQLYVCQLLSEMPVEPLRHYYYPGVTTKGGRDGLLVEVRSHRGRPWVGTFAFGTVAPSGFSGLFATPDGEQLCVVSRGEGYLVNAITPTTWEAVSARPIIDVRPIRNQEIIVFANFTELVAHGPSGIKWRTKRLAWDNLKITKVGETFLRGEFWDIRREAVGNFVVDLATGKHTGGMDEI
jgi:hypothetical protein